MNIHIRNAKEKDLDEILLLLSQVLELHASIRPDIFISGTTKYSKEELRTIISDQNRPVYVAVTDEDHVAGYAFCQFKKQPVSENMVPFTSLSLDDLCVDGNIRGKHIGRQLFEHVKQEAKSHGCYEVTLNVWEGNVNAQTFYEKMGLKVQASHMEYIL